MNPQIETLKRLPYVRRVVLSEGCLGALTDDSIPVDRPPPALRDSVATFHAPMSVAAGAECEVLWDRVAEELKSALADEPGFRALKHRWCREDEQVEVEVGRKVDHLHFSASDTKVVPSYPEGVYAVVYEATADDRRKAPDTRHDTLVDAKHPRPGETYAERMRRELAAMHEDADEPDDQELSALASVAGRVNALLSYIPDGQPWGIELVTPAQVTSEYKAC